MNDIKNEILDLLLIRNVKINILYKIMVVWDVLGN